MLSKVRSSGASRTTLVGEAATVKAFKGDFLVRFGVIGAAIRFLNGDVYAGFLMGDRTIAGSSSTASEIGARLTRLLKRRIDRFFNWLSSALLAIVSAARALRSVWLSSNTMSGCSSVIMHIFDVVDFFFIGPTGMRVLCRFRGTTLRSSSGNDAGFVLSCVSYDVIVGVAATMASIVSDRISSVRLHSEMASYL